jgi:hypothetical protein
MYRQYPRKAITDLYLVSDEPNFDPYGGWDGFWVDLTKVTPIKDIPMKEMKCDEVLKHWNFIKMQSQGTITDPVPPTIYNRLLEKIDISIIHEYNLQPEPVMKAGYSGQFSSEEEFKDKVVEPLLKRWGFKYQRQYPCEFIIGSQSHLCQIDFLVRDEKRILTLFEDKLKITSDKELSKAALQAKSYSLQLGVSTFVVASPEGFWIYRLEKAKEILIQKIDYSEFNVKNELLRNLIVKSR